MIAPIQESREEMTFVQYRKDVKRLRQSMQSKYQHEFPEEFIRDFAEFIHTYVL